jgi:hypothetical protein
MVAHKNHDKVIHARISKDLYEKIASRAKKHRVTVSNLLRNVVEDYLDIQGDVLGIVHEKINDYLDKRQSIVGSQSIMVEKETVCRLCQKKVGRGQEAFVAFLEGTSRTMVICKECRNKNKG